MGMGDDSDHIGSVIDCCDDAISYTDSKTSHDTVSSIRYIYDDSAVSTTGTVSHRLTRAMYG